MGSVHFTEPEIWVFLLNSGGQRWSIDRSWHDNVSQHQIELCLASLDNAPRMFTTSACQDRVVAVFKNTPDVWLMASSHGAGLMLVPVLLEGRPVFCGATSSSTNSLLFFHPLVATAAVGIHTISHLVIAGLIAWVVYDFIGLAVLRRSWINLDLIWCLSLIGTAAILFFVACA